MQIEYVNILDFRNLKQFEITISNLKTVLIGQNATGKSNFIEAIVLIFKQLDFPEREHKAEHLFDYEIIYTCYQKRVKIRRFKDEDKYKYKFFESSILEGDFREVPFIEIRGFNKKKSQYLPKYIFAYYSGLGNSNRLEEHFEEHKADFARRAMNAKNNNVPNPARLFYAELIHSQLSLLSFFIEEKPKALTFLKNTIGIEIFQSVLLTVEKPSWSSEARMKKNNEFKFFGSSGVVKNLLYFLNDNVSFAPFRDTIKPRAGLWEKFKGKKGQEVVYLFIDDFTKIRKYVRDNRWSSFDFFHVLNTANVSQLLRKDGIKVRVRKGKSENISFRDLSEGEQQLLTVLGLMRFTVTDEALFLLDEPDTHLNPYWRWKYMDFIDEIVLEASEDKNDLGGQKIQVIMSSHDPLTIGSLCKEEVRVLRRNKEGKVSCSIPDEDPKGMGAAGILTEVFGLETTLDKKTQEQLERRRHIESMLYNLHKHNEALPENEMLTNLNIELESLNKELQNLGISRVIRDPLYQKFQARFDSEMKYRKSTYEPLNEIQKLQQEKIMDNILKELIDEEGL